MRAHRHLEVALAKAAQHVGMQVDCERFIPELYQQLAACEDGETRIKKAIMDVVLAAPGVESLLLVDVSIRSAVAARYSTSASPGFAARTGEADKFRRYDASVLPLVFECGGRLGVASRESLVSIVSTAAAARLCHPSSVASWRSRCERAVLWATADVALRASGAAASLGHMC